MASEPDPDQDSDTWETASEEHGMPLENAGSGTSAGTWSAAEVAKGVNQHGCEHYRRRCKLVAPCCGDVVWCRHCHNIVRSDNEQDPKKRHILDRKAVTEVVCALCDTRQPAATQCMHCGAGFGRFSCLKCKFYDDDVSKEQFHCDKCGICRVGGRANYFHCDRCNCCYALALQDTHTCIENSMHHNCPVCFEYLFDSVKPIQVLPCGHTIHQDCLKSMAEHHSFTCPECNKSFLNAAQMAGVWARMDAAVAATAMPDEYKNMKVDILCNDCNKRCSVNFHVVGHKCSSCGSYNTARV